MSCGEDVTWRRFHKRKMSCDENVTWQRFHVTFLFPILSSKTYQDSKNEEDDEDSPARRLGCDLTIAHCRHGHNEHVDTITIRQVLTVGKLNPRITRILHLGRVKEIYITTTKIGLEEFFWQVLNKECCFSTYKLNMTKYKSFIVTTKLDAIKGTSQVFMPTNWDVAQLTRLDARWGQLHLTGLGFTVRKDVGMGIIHYRSTVGRAGCTAFPTLRINYVSCSRAQSVVTGDSNPLCRQHQSLGPVN